MHESPIPAVMERALSDLSPVIRNHILERLQSPTDYEHIIGIVGKFGTGKSSLCNALFSGEVSLVRQYTLCFTLSA
jgi:predicted GTPase